MTEDRNERWPTFPQFIGILLMTAAAGLLALAMVPTSFWLLTGRWPA